MVKVNPLLSCEAKDMAFLYFMNIRAEIIF